ncbi:MAG: hypothetical protein LBI99_06775, partial [Propionibacteriaceae bacterium]|nr:hypothetical protein [Propionibacteriaceae bacterium]
MMSVGHHPSRLANGGGGVADTAARGGRDRRSESPRSRSVSRGHLAPHGYLWILPAFALCVGVIYYCIGYSVYISTLSWDGLSSYHQDVGFENYQRLFTDPLFWGALWHTLV